MNESIKKLLSLQERDLAMDRLQAELSAIPAKISALKAQIQDNKTALENAKKELTQLQLTKKNREVDLEAQETVIRKHSTELNSVKSNDAYKALLGEIEKAKNDRSVLEDQILLVMDQIDLATRSWKQKEVESKSTETDYLRQISEWETQQKSLEDQLTQKRQEREQSTGDLPKNLYEQYSRLRLGGRGSGVVPIRSEQCSGCHMKVSQNLINEVRRGQKLMACEHCSRIVYLEEVPAPNAG